jgi:hypothetical protein
MENSLNKFGIALAACLIELALVKYGHFAFGGLIVIFALIGGLMILMGHKSIGWGMVLGTIVFTFVLLLLGWTFMEGWLTPQEMWDGKSFMKQ